MGTNYIIDSIDIEDANGTLPFSVYVCDEFFNNLVNFIWIENKCQMSI